MPNCVFANPEIGSGKQLTEKENRADLDPVRSKPGSAGVHRFCTVLSLGRVSYRRGLELQREAFALVRAGGEDRILLLEHDPVLTIGRGGSEANLLVSREILAQQGIELHEVERGGDITYHGPGQLVGYPILGLNQHGRDVHKLLRGYEEAAIRALSVLGIQARRDPAYTGVWVGEDKIMAIGVAVRHWVSYHGFALNIDPNLDHFKLINPCGITDRGVTSLAKILGRPVERTEMERLLLRELSVVFGLEMRV